MKGNSVRKVAFFSVMVGFFTALMLFWGAVHEARALVVATDRYTISGSISPTTSALQDVWFVGEYSSFAPDPPNFFAQPLGTVIPGGTTTPFSFTVSYLGSAPSSFTILAMYPPDAGATVGSNTITAGTPWTTLFPATLEANLVVTLGAAYTLPALIPNIENFYATNTGILGAPMGSTLSLWNFEIASAGGSVNASVVPLPAAVFLFGPGLVGLAAVRRRLMK